MKTKRKWHRKGTLRKLKEELEVLQKQMVICIYGRDCYTCNKKTLEGSNCQLGHVPWPRSDLGPKAKFDPRYTRIQCFHCNINLGGAGAIALQRMIDEGIDVKELREESEKEKGKTVTTQWYSDRIEEYKKEVDNLMSAFKFVV